METKTLSRCVLAMVAATLAGCGDDPKSSSEEVGLTEAPLSSGPDGYVGCFTDSGDRALPYFVGSGFGIEPCRQMAGEAGMRYAGLQYGGECWVGNDVGYDRVDDGECDVPCANGQQACGGTWRNSIYTAVVSTPAPPNPQVAVVMGWIDGVSANSEVYGWACAKTIAPSIQVHLYLGGPAGQGRFSGVVEANQWSEPAVAAQCYTNGSAYRFTFPRPVAYNSGARAYVYGISPIGGENLPLYNSGAFSVY